MDVDIYLSEHSVFILIRFVVSLCFAIQIGNAIVIFAYGLSGSGKTFSVFGVDAATNPESWFFQADDTTKASEMWGVLPRLVFEVSVTYSTCM